MPPRGGKKHVDLDPHRDSDEEDSERETDDTSLIGDASRQIKESLEFWPKFTNKNVFDVMKRAHRYNVFFYVLAEIAYVICISIVPQLGVDRSLTVEIGPVIRPSVNASMNPWSDLFYVGNRSTISNIPPMVFFIIWAGVAILYHGFFFFYPTQISKYLHDQQNPIRWMYMAVVKILYAILLFAYNGEREITSFMFLSVGIIGICYVAHTFETFGCSSESEGEGTNKGKVKCHMIGMLPDSVTTSQVLLASSFIIYTAFIIRIVYNHKSTPEWVFGMSIAFLVSEVLTTLYYIHSVHNTKCAVHRSMIKYASIEWNTMAYQFAVFVSFSATAIAKQAAI